MLYILVALLSLSAATAIAASGPVKRALKLTEQDSATWQLAVHEDHAFMRDYHVYPDGTPTPDEQGKLYRGGRLFAPPQITSKLCLSGGQYYRQPENEYLPWFRLRAKEQRIVIVVADNCMRVTIHHDRPLTPADVTPTAIATALGGFFTVTGPNIHLGGTIAEKIDDLLQPIAIQGRRVEMAGFRFTLPEGWQADRLGQAVVLEGTGSGHRVEAEALVLSATERRAGVMLVLSDSYPNRLRQELRSLDRKSGLLNTSTPKTEAGIVSGWADGYAGRQYLARYWFVDVQTGAGLQFRETGRARDAERHRITFETLATSLQPLQPAQTTDPTIEKNYGLGDLEVTASPTEVGVGDTVSLGIEFALLGPDGDETPVTVSWALSHAGRTLPNFPREQQSLRSHGTYEPSLRQTIPAGAPAGRYQFKGEVCAADECRSKKAEFRVLP